MSGNFDFSAVNGRFQLDRTVTVNFPKKGVGVEVKTFTATLALLGEAEIEAAIKDVEDNKTDADRAMAKQYLVGLPDGPELTEDYLKKFLLPPFIVLGLKAAYQDFAGGVAEKN